jgi:ABC-type antimicrobial peptide transport system permease subunit
MKPLSAFYYIKNNKGRAALIIFMLFFTIGMFIAGNFIQSMDWYWEEGSRVDDKIVLLNLLPTDVEDRDFNAVCEEIEADPKLHILYRTGLGFGGLSWNSTLGFEIGAQSYVFNSPEELKEVFEFLGLHADLSGIHEGSVIVGKALARNRKLNLGDTVDGTVERSLSRAFTLDALIDEDLYATFYIAETGTNRARAYVYSEEMEGEELHSYLAEKIGGRKVKMDDLLRNYLKKEIRPLYLVMIAGAVLLSIILAVTVNSVVNGQYIRRTYEFGVYRALGLSKGRIIRKTTGELLLMDFIAVVIGVGVAALTTFLLNELYYIPEGRYLPYFSMLGLICFFIANLTVMVPMIISKGRRMSRADVTEF